MDLRRQLPRLVLCMLCAPLLLGSALLTTGCWGSSPAEDDPITIGDAGGDGGSQDRCSTGEVNGKCAAGSQCAADADCASGVCSDAGVCLQASCGNGKQDGDETGPDCGGSCPKCVGDACSRDSHCRSNYCKGSACAAPSCTDNEHNGAETGVDCGGDCGSCPVGEACRVDSDCETGRCEGGRCAELPASCSDGEQNGEETGRDCGGPMCGACPLDERCNDDGDCLSGFCDFGKCKRPTCTDMIKNQDESDVDCGGPACSACPPGKACNGNVDCQSQRCAGGVCVTCSDGSKNGQETDVDCGGPCDKCADGKSCEAASDCQSGRCAGGVCATCNDGTQNGQETGVDCGGPCGPCEGGASCQTNADCQTDLCTGGTCCTKNTEVCDGTDNDCDEQIDEGCSCTNGETMECGQSTGECQPGTQTCSGGRWGSCSGNRGPSTERCDGDDNDCDGVTDEDCPCDYKGKRAGVCDDAKRNSRGQCTAPFDYESTERSCDDTDNDCDGTVDEVCKELTGLLGSSADDLGLQVAVDSNRNFYLAGWSQGDLPGAKNRGITDGFIAKYDSNGSRKWVKAVANSERQAVLGITADHSGNLYVTGSFWGSFGGESSTGLSDVFVAKYDTSGTRKWTTSLGSSDRDLAREVTVGPFGDVYVVGDAGGTIEGESVWPGEDAFVARLDDRTGSKKWLKTFNEHGSGEGKDVAVGRGVVWIAVTVESSGNDDVGYLVKYSTSGTEKADHKVATTADVHLHGVDLDRSGNVYAVGETKGQLGRTSHAGHWDAFAISYTSTGRNRWTHQFGTGGTDDGKAIVYDSDTRDVFVTGFYDSFDTFVRRIDGSRGHEKWSKYIKGVGLDPHYGYGITTDAKHNAYVAGRTEAGNFDGHKSAGGIDAFFWRVKKIK